MISIPKIKKIKIIYKAKIKIRNTKNLFKDIIFLFFNKSKFKNIINFIKNHFKKLKVSFDRNDFYQNKYFDHGDWFIHKAPLIMNYFDNTKKNNIIEILEIGSWEGRSACFFLKYFQNSLVTCVDTWEGSPENFNKDVPDLSGVENNFDRNIVEFKHRVIKHKMDSKSFFNMNKIFFDLIYIDGSHFHDDVLNDAKDGFNSLKKNSYILFDDYDWNYYNHGKNPINAINSFLEINKIKIKIIYISSQVLIKKIV